MVRSLYACKHHILRNRAFVPARSFAIFFVQNVLDFCEKICKTTLSFSPSWCTTVHLHTANGNIISRQKPLFHFGKITDGRTSEGDDGTNRKALGKPLGRRLIHKSELRDEHLAAASLLIQLLTIHVVTWRWTEKWMLHLPFVRFWYAYYDLVMMLPLQFDHIANDGDDDVLRVSLTFLMADDWDGFICWQEPKKFWCMWRNARRSWSVVLRNCNRTRCCVKKT